MTDVLVVFGVTVLGLLAGFWPALLMPGVVQRQDHGEH
jgi:hypothetical protein